MPNRAGLAEPDSTEFTDEPIEAQPARQRRKWPRILLISGLSVLLLLGGVLAAGGLYLKSVDSNVKRVDAFDDVPVNSRPAPVVQGAENLLILGSDTRD